MKNKKKIKGFVFNYKTERFYGVNLNIFLFDKAFYLMNTRVWSFCGINKVNIATYFH